MVAAALFSLLAALGTVTAVWCVIGTILLPAAGDGYVLIRGETERALRTARGCLFLRRCGLLRMPLRVAVRFAEAPEWLRQAAEDRELSIIPPGSPEDH